MTEVKNNISAISKASYLSEQLLKRVKDSSKITTICDNGAMAINYVFSEEPPKTLCFALDMTEGKIAIINMLGCYDADEALIFALDALHRFESTNEPFIPFRTRDEIKDTLEKYLDIGSLNEARNYILPRLGYLTEQEANQLLLSIHDEMINEGRLVEYDTRT